MDLIDSARGLSLSDGEEGKNRLESKFKENEKSF